MTAYPVRKARHPVLRAVLVAACIALGAAIGSQWGNNDQLVIEDGRLKCSSR